VVVLLTAELHTMTLDVLNSFADFSQTEAKTLTSTHHVEIPYNFEI
jgi:hypothetical protein